MKQTYIYRITNKEDKEQAWYVYAANQPSAKRWLWENHPEIKADFECVGMNKVPLGIHAQEFTSEEYEAIKQRISDMTNPFAWKRFSNSQ